MLNTLNIIIENGRLSFQLDTEIATMGKAYLILNKVTNNEPYVVFKDDFEKIKSTVIEMLYKFNPNCVSGDNVCAIYIDTDILDLSKSDLLKIKINKDDIFNKSKALRKCLLGMCKEESRDKVSKLKEMLKLMRFKPLKPVIRKHIYGMPVTRKAIVGDKEIPIEPLTPADMEKMMKEAGVLKIKPGEDLNPFYSAISPARRTMFKEAADEIGRLLSTPNYGVGFVKTGYEASKCNYGNLDKISSKIYPCVHEAVKEFKESKVKPGHIDTEAYFVVIATKDRVELVNIRNIANPSCKIYFYTMHDTLVIKKEENIYDLGHIVSNGDIGPNDIGKQSKKLTSDMIKYVLDKLPVIDKYYINRIVRICFTSEFMSKYKDEKTKGEFFTVIDGKSTMSSLSVLPSLSFSTVNKCNFVLDTHFEINRLMQKGEI